MSQQKRRLRKIQHEVVSLVEYLLAEVYATGEEKKYRFKIPYGALKKDSEQISPNALIVVDMDVYFDGELTHEREERTVFKVAGPYKNRQ